MTPAEIEFLMRLSESSVLDAEIEARGWSDLATHLQSRSLVQRDVIAGAVELSWVGRMLVPKRHSPRV